MSATGSFTFVVATCLLAAVLAAQSRPPAVIQGLLPPDAKIIETARLPGIDGKPRELVLWMANPKEEARKPGLGYCGDSVYGDHWLGPTSLSLVNLAGPMLLNTVEITGPAFMSDPAESFRLPFFVANYYYTVPKIDSNREGVPRILNLRDLTGDGIAAEFVLFMYGACGIVPTGVFGYSQQADRAVWYAIEVSDGKQKAAVQFWVDQVFARKPVRPGYWDFKWDPGHGADVTIRDQVSFDAARQLFVIKQTTTPYSETVHPK